MGRTRIVLALTAFGALLLLSLWVPLYTDEIATKLQLARALDEGGMLVSMLPQCATSHLRPLPLVWWPAAAIYKVAFGGLGLLGLRLSGIVVAALTCAAGWLALRRVGGGPRARVHRYALFVAMQAVGLAPLAFASARSEGVLVLCLVLFTGFALGGWAARATSPLVRAGLVVGFLVLTSVFTYTHSKAIFFAPLVVVTAVLAFPKARPAYLATALVGALLVIGGSYRHVRSTSGCQESPSVQTFFDALVASPALAASDPKSFLALADKDVVEAASRTVETMSLAWTYEAGWLAPDPEKKPADEPLPPVARIGNAATWLVLRGAQVLLVFAVLGALVGLPLSRSRRTRRPLAFSLTLLVGLVAHLAFAKHWPFYHSPFLVAVTSLLVAVLGSVLLGPIRVETRDSPGFRRVLRHVVTAVVVLAAVSAAGTLLHLGPRLVHAAAHVGTALPDQPTSTPAFAYGGERAKIRAHAETCGIRGDGATHLVVDDATLFAFEDLRRPYHLFYVSDRGVWAGDRKGEANVAFLRDIGATGIIARCGFFPTALAAKAKTAGDYCCVGPEDLGTR